jgi:ferritin-like metal-binding protein YciE
MAPAVGAANSRGDVPTMSLNTPRDLFVHELSDSMSAEHIVFGMLGDLEKETGNKDVKDAISHHRKETEQQIANLEKAFDILGEKPEKTTCHAAEGLKQEHDALGKENPPELVLEIGNLAGAAKTEHYEIASYTMLMQMAKDLGEKEIADLLKENLDQEKEMARKVQSLGKQLGKEAKAQMKDAEQQSA